MGRSLSNKKAALMKRETETIRDQTKVEREKNNTGRKRGILQE